MGYDVQLTLSYSGGDTEEHAIDFYDVAQALEGFQRSLALTVHLVLNGEIITQAPSLRGARILALPAEDGSWKITAGLIFTGLYALGTLSNDSPLGHLVYSVYDYVISESLGVHVDYDKSLGQLYEESKEKKLKLSVPRQSQMDSLMEKCIFAITEMHRPIYKSGSASGASIVVNVRGQKLPLHARLNAETYEFIHETFESEEAEVIEGRVSSYNSNTYKGRIYVL